MQNILPVHLGPDGVDQCAVSEPFDQQVAQLESGSKTVNIKGHDYACVGGVGLVSVDMPQGQKICGCLAISANHPCRACTVGGNQLFAGKVHEFEHARTYLTSKILRDKVDATPSLSTATGCKGNVPTMLQRSTFSRRRQVPYEPFHAMVMGNSAQVLLLVAALLTPQSFADLNLRIARLPRPCNWSSALPSIIINSKESKVKMGGQDVKNVVQMLHLVCVGWMKVEHLTRKYRKLFKVKGIVIKDVLDAIALQAVVNNLVFAEEHHDGPDSGNVLDATLHRCREAAVKAWGELGIINIYTMNRHAPVVHYKETHNDFGGLCNVNAARFETKHGSLRKANRNSNNHFPEVAMFEKENIRCISLFLLLLMIVLILVLIIIIIICFSCALF